MAEGFASIQRPQRWDVPFGEKMTDGDAQWLLAQEPFRRMDVARFPAGTSLAGILRNDCRIVHHQPGDLVLREGDYGNSAFLVLSGLLRVVLEKMPAELLGRERPKKRTFFQTIAQLWSNPAWPEVRDYSIEATGSGPAARNGRLASTGTRTNEAGTSVFLQDVPGVLDRHNTVRLGQGEMFGEMAAMSRTPRTATVFAEDACTLLEIRWQGLRLLRRDKRLQEHLDRLYRENSLRVHLRETPLFRRLPESSLAAIADATIFETYGNFEWMAEYKQLAGAAPATRIEAEPLIAQEGHYANDLWMIRSGFARVCRRHGDGHKTMSYIGKGRMFGLREIVHNAKTSSGQIVPYQDSLRATGYVDVLRIPAGIAVKHILPHLPATELPRESPASLNPSTSNESRVPGKLPDRRQPLPTALMEFLVERRLANGTQAMVVDLDRCTRCDDCVRACAATHEGNPRFLREGPRHGKYLFASACMHCADPVCMIGCPTGAISRDEKSGNVTINDGTCIGCATCANSCPYQNIRMVEILDPSGTRLQDRVTELPIFKATKCDMCHEQRTGPACQNACPHDALIRIDLTETTPLSDWREGNWRGEAA